MDISIISVAPPSAPRSAAPSGGEAGNGFSQHLQQAVDRESRIAPKPTVASNAQASGSHPADAHRGAATSEEQAPAQAVSALPLQMPNDTQSNLAALPSILPQTVATLAGAMEGSPMLPSKAVLDPLEEIRRRLALIEQAGQLPDEVAAAGLVALATTPSNQAPAPEAAQKELDVLTAFAARANDDPQPLPTAPQQVRTAVEATAEASVDATVEAAPAPAQSPVAHSGKSAPEPASGVIESRLIAPAEGLTRVEPSQAAFASVQAGSPAPTGAAQAPEPAAPSLSAPLASREWQAGLGQQLIGLYQRGEQQIDLHLHPAELGPLSVSLKLGELGAQAQFISANPQVRSAIEQAIPQLREALASQGINLGETSVGDQHRPASEQQGEGGASRRGSALAQTGDAIEEQPLAPPLRMLQGQVDLYA